MVTIKSKREIELMKEACHVVAILYDELEKKIKPGMSTWDVDILSEKIIRREGAIPAEKGFTEVRGVPPYPASICISINDEVIHGVPSKHKIIREGDIVSIDTVALKNGFNGDAARTFMIGNVSKDARRLVEITKQAFFEGIKYAKPGYRIGDVSHAIGEFVRSNGYSVVREFQGHGIGLKITNELKRLIETNVSEGEKMQIELTPTAGNEAFYEKAGFKYKPDKITGMYLWIKK